MRFVDRGSRFEVWGLGFGGLGSGFGMRKAFAGLSGPVSPAIKQKHAFKMG